MEGSYQTANVAHSYHQMVQTDNAKLIGIEVLYMPCKVRDRISNLPPPPPFFYNTHGCNIQMSKNSVQIEQHSPSFEGVIFEKRSLTFKWYGTDNVNLIAIAF